MEWWQQSTLIDLGLIDCIGAQEMKSNQDWRWTRSWRRKLESKLGYVTRQTKCLLLLLCVLAFPFSHVCLSCRFITSHQQHCQWNDCEGATVPQGLSPPHTQVKRCYSGIHHIDPLMPMVCDLYSHYLAKETKKNNQVCSNTLLSFSPFWYEKGANLNIQRECHFTVNATNIV